VVEAVPATTPFIGPEQLMRETKQAQLVRLGANESAFGPSPRAVEAMSRALPRLAWYGDPESLDLRDALAEKHRCVPEEILVGAGIDDLMGLAVRAFAGPGDTALWTLGTYPTFSYHVIGYGGRPLTVPYRTDGTPDCDALIETARRESPTIVYLANPDNPSGRFTDRRELIAFYEALPHDALLLLDEAYADFVDEADLLPPSFDDRLVRLRTFSKAFGLAGARIGYALSSRRNIEIFSKIRLQYGVNRNAQIGALESLRDEPFRRHVVDETAQAREEYYRLAQELGRRYIESRTNFVCIDFGTASAATRVMSDLLAHGVWVRKPGAPPLDSCIRVSAGTASMRATFAAALRAVVSEVAV